MLEPVGLRSGDGRGQAVGHWGHVQSVLFCGKSVQTSMGLGESVD
jgi:hypothetical protein